MRSVFIYFPETSRPEIVEWLEREIGEATDARWQAPPGNDAVLFCEFDNLNDLGPQGRAAVSAAIGGPAGLLVADVSGKVPGDDEVRWLVLGLLTAVPEAVAGDDFSTSVWTLEEIKVGNLKSGHPFFDYQGWHEETS